MPSWGSMTPRSPWSHHLVLPAERSSAHEVRQFVRRHMVEHGLPELVDDVQLVATELATNSILHARTPFTVTLSWADQRVILRVRDRSPRTVVQVDADPLDANGRGLTIVSRLSQKWGVTHGPEGSKAVWASFDAPEGPPRTW